MRESESTPEECDGKDRLLSEPVGQTAKSLIPSLSSFEDKVRQVLQEHGTSLLLPDDEFDCCVKVISALMEQEIERVNTG